MRPFLIVSLLLTMVACSSGSGGTTGAAGVAGAAAGVAGTTGTGGAPPLVECPGIDGHVPATCCDSPSSEPSARCTATLEQQLPKSMTCPGATATVPIDETCGAYRMVGITCNDTVRCVYDGQGQLVAWEICGDTSSALPADYCSHCRHGGRHPAGEVTKFFTPGAPGPCHLAP